MKSKRTKIFVIILLILIIPPLGLKTYFEIDNAIYESRISKINQQSSRPKSLIEHKILEQDGYNIHYYISGQANDDLIVFLHPAYSDHRAFDQQIDYFSKNYRVITIDLIGHGLSKTNESKNKIDASSNHIEKILSIEGFNKAHFVGVSMGSWIAQYFAFNHPDKIKSLTALGGYDINKKSQMNISTNPSMILRAIFSIQSLRKEFAEISCKTENGQALFYKYSSLFERKSLLAMSGILTIIKDREGIQPNYSTLILTGELDIDSNKKMAKEWHSYLMKSELSMIKNAGHCANIDNSLDFNELLETFIQKTNNN